MLKVMTAISWLKALARRDEGVTAIEYGLIAGLVAIVIIAAATLTGTNLTAIFERIAAALAAAA